MRLERGLTAHLSIAFSPISINLFFFNFSMGNGLGNKILFPAPLGSYDDSLPGLIVQEDSIVGRQAFLHIAAPSRPSERPYVLYFHGNACDIGTMLFELKELASHSNANVVAVEYPGYGILSDSYPTAKGINEAADNALQYLIKKGVECQKIFFFGRSIGSGPAARLASLCTERGLQIGGLVLQSPYKSVHSIVRDYASVGTWFIDDHWRNDEVVSNPHSQWPLLIIHGEQDEVIGSVKHGKALFVMSVSTRKKLVNPPNATHNEWHLYRDVLFPVRDFLAKYGQY